MKTVFSLSIGFRQNSLGVHIRHIAVRIVPQIISRDVQQVIANISSKCPLFSSNEDFDKCIECFGLTYLPDDQPHEVETAHVLRHELDDEFEWAIRKQSSNDILHIAQRSRERGIKVHFNTGVENHNENKR
jgi:hypothetical protein